MKSLSRTSLLALVLAGLLGALASASTRLMQPSPNHPNIEKPDQRPIWRAVPRNHIFTLSNLVFDTKSESCSGTFGCIRKAAQTLPIQQADGTIVEKKVTVAAKCLKYRYEYDKGSGIRHLQSLAQEYVIHRAAAKVAPYGVVSVYDFFKDKNNPNKKCFTMQYAPAKDLMSMLIKAGRHMPEVLAKTIMYRIIYAVGILGIKKIFHRDIKPDNIVFLPGYLPKLVDFGLATYLDERSPKTRQRALVGSEDYQAPEILSKTLGMTRKDFFKADVYSLGMTIQAIATDHVPTNLLQDARHFPSLQAFDLVQCMLNEQPDQRCTIMDVEKHEWFSTVRPHFTGDDTKGFEVLQAVMKAEATKAVEAVLTGVENVDRIAIEKNYAARSMAEVEQWLADAGYSKEVSA